MNGTYVFSAPAQGGGPYDYAAQLQVASRPVDLESLTALNGSATNYYLQLFNLPFSPTNDATGKRSTTVSGNTATLAAHKFQDGDQATISDGTHTGSGYVRPLTAATFQLYDTRAHAQDRTATTGIVSLAAIVGTITTLWTAGVNTDEAGNERAVVPEELPLLGTGSTPANIASYLNGRFSRGLYVRAVTALNGSTLAGADVKFVPRFR